MKYKIVNECLNNHKEYKYLYRRMLDYNVIRKAYKKLRKGKTKRKEIIKIDANLDKEVEAMYEMIKNTKPPDVPVEHPEKAFNPKKKVPKIITEHGKRRKIYMPEIHEQWLHHIIVLILAPIIIATAYRFTCGSFPNRGAHYGKKHVERWIRQGANIKYYAKIDIRHFYDNIRLDIMIRELSIRVKDEWFLYIIRTCFKYFDKGIPLGFYLSQWMANYLLEPLDKFITRDLGLKLDIRYMDDMTIFSDNKKRLHNAIVQIKKYIGRRFRLKLKRNYQVCRFYFIKKSGKVTGRCLDFMGFKFYRNKTVIRKYIMISASRLAASLYKAKAKKRGYYIRQIKAMLSYMGWFSCSDTYNCYLEHVKPYVSIKKLKKIVSKMDRRDKKNETVDNGNMCGITGNAAINRTRHLYAAQKYQAGYT